MTPRLTREWTLWQTEQEISWACNHIVTIGCPINWTDATYQLDPEFNLQCMMCGGQVGKKENNGRFSREGLVVLPVGAGARESLSKEVGMSDR